MDALERFNGLVEKLLSTSGRLEKESYLKEYSKDKDVLEILKFLFDPYVVTGISDKKLDKAKKKGALPMLIMTLMHVDFMDVIAYFRKHNTGRDQDVNYLVDSANNTPHRELMYGIIKRDLKLGIQNTTLNKVFGEGFVPKFDVMLAESYEENQPHLVDKDFIITEKFDGIRCLLLFENGEPSFRTRGGQAVFDLVELTEQVKHLDPNFVYDGELLLENPDGLKSDDLYRATVKVVNADGAKKGVVFNIFDMVSREGFKNGIDLTPCIDRKTRINTIITDLHKKKLAPMLKPVEIFYMGRDTKKIDFHLDRLVKKGAEGVMLNVADAPYESKRTKNLLKVKKFYTADVLVVDVEEGSGANVGKLGAVYVKFIGPDKKEYTCKVGSGFKQEEREQFWADKNLIKDKIIEIG
ncbi:MAG: hypothetical protein FWC00_05750, partial [Firmicutes bacterium]|nr:hypothetical protein [Bacillota bacterium]